MSRFTMDYLCKCGHRAKVKRDTRDNFPSSLVCPYCTDVLKPTAGGPVVNFDVQPQVNPGGEDNAGFVQDYLCRCGNKHTSYRERGNRFPDHLACIVCGLYEGLKKVDTVVEIGKVVEVCLCDTCEHHFSERDADGLRFCLWWAKNIYPRKACNNYRVSPKEAARLAREAFKADPRLPVFGGLDVKNKTLGVTLPPGWSITVKQES